MALLETEPLILIIVVVLILFGATAIPKLARSMGRAKGEFTKAKKEFDLEATKAETETATSPTEEQVRKTARDLGIQEQGKSLAEVKALINQKIV
jgi:sec-independent protein translocase protein TatA